MGAEWFHEDERTDSHDETQSTYSQFFTGVLYSDRWALRG